MKPAHLVILILLLLATAAVYRVFEANDGRDDLEAKAGLPTRSAREIRANLSPEEAFDRLRGWTSSQADIKKAPDLFGMELMARKLSQRDLERLIAELKFEDSSGLKGWVRSALFADVEDLADLGELEAGGLGGADGGDPGDGLFGVVAVARRGAGGFGEQALVFVEAQGLDAGAGCGGELTDLHDVAPSKRRDPQA